MVVVAAFYQFFTIDNSTSLKELALARMTALGIKGTMLVASEGINATVCGTRASIDQLRNFLIHDCGFVNLEYKESLTTSAPFKRLKVKVKPEIVTMKQPQAKPSEVVGTYVNAQEWNQLLTDPEVTVLDVRNDFEVAMGSFVNAHNPHTKAFSDFPDFVQNNLSPAANRKIAMSCTGGIRCEKASSYLKLLGFHEVYHLKGGVLQYLQDMPKEDSLWRGECFIFDERIALDHDLKPKK